MSRAAGLPSTEQLGQRIERGARELLPSGLAAETCRVLAAHLRLLYRWNERVNLTAIRDIGEGVIRHTLESLEALPLLPPEGCLVDLGSGNGYPALPCLHAVPGLHGILCESVGRKVDFLRAAVRESGLLGRVEVRQVRLRGPRSLPKQGQIVTMRGFPSPGSWATGAFECQDVTRVLAWVSSADATRIRAEVERAGLVGTIHALRSHPTGAILVVRRP